MIKWVKLGEAVTGYIDGKAVWQYIVDSKGRGIGSGGAIVVVHIDWFRVGSHRFVNENELHKFFEEAYI